MKVRRDIYSNLRLDTCIVSAAELGQESPLPSLDLGADIHAGATAAPGIPDDMASNMALGRLPNLLPYLQQAGLART